MPLYIGTHATDCVKVYRGVYPFCKIYQGSTLKWWASDCQACVKYGYLYNWYAATDARGIASAGWHVPSKTEFETLETYLGGASVAGGKLKETGFTHWDVPNTGATNESGFSARPGGSRVNVNGEFWNIGFLSVWWTSTIYVPLESWYWIVYANSGVLYNQHFENVMGYSLRLLKDDSDDEGTMTGNDGKVYKTVKIGDQVWMAENLAETEYADHSKISIVEDATVWAGLTAGAMCAYDNDYTLVGCGETEPTWANVEYGLLYNWYAATDPRYIAPSGWHVPTITEFQTLSTYLGGDSVAGGHLKQTGTTYWDTQSAGTDNSSGFTARGAGVRVSGLFSGLKASSAYLTSSDFGSGYYWNATLGANSDAFNVSSYIAEYVRGDSIRLIKDDSNDEGTMTDNDGYIYPTVKIGTQVWMAANLKTTKYRNGDTIPEVTDNSAWAALTTGALCAYNNDWDNV